MINISIDLTFLITLQRKLLIQFLDHLCIKTTTSLCFMLKDLMFSFIILSGITDNLLEIRLLFPDNYLLQHFLVSRMDP